MALDERKGVWKSGKGKGRTTPKGRQLDDQAWDEVRALLGDRPRRRDLLIEFLHLIQDAYGHLSAAHLRALAEELRVEAANLRHVDVRRGVRLEHPCERRAHTARLVLRLRDESFRRRAVLVPFSSYHDPGNG